jgi:hypothetical protein
MIVTDLQPYTPLTVPADTDQFIYRYVTKVRNSEVVCELTQIGIRQP